MFRFTIRDVLWLMVVVGLAVGWWIDRWAFVGRCESLERSNLWLDNRYHQAVLAFEEQISTLQARAKEPAK